LEFKVIDSTFKILKEKEAKQKGVQRSSFERIFIFGVFEGDEGSFFKK
jgi:hypothetical protein